MFERSPKATTTPVPSLRVVEEAQTELGALLTKLDTRRKGLTKVQIRQRLKKFGYNEIVFDRPSAWLPQLLQSFHSPFMYLLVGLAIVSLVIGDPKAALVLLAMVLLGGILRFFQEYRSNRAAQKLRAMVGVTATVSRFDDLINRERQQRVNIYNLVPGDIIHLAVGDIIPADVRLLTAKDFFVSQAVLTGESTPTQKHDTVGDRIEKIAIAYHHPNPNPLDTPTVCFMGTTVIGGVAKAVVVATGSQTYLGSLTQQLVTSKQTATSFEQGVNQVTWLLLRFIAVMAAIVFVTSSVTQGDLREAFLFAIAIGVGLTPEMLPLIVSANLVRGATVMAKHRVIIKRLSAMQNLGAMDILCIDKTGTLTQNQILLEQYLDVQGNVCEQVLIYAYLNSYFQNGLKHPIDTAILAKAELNQPIYPKQNYHKVDEVPFDFVRRRLSVVLGNETEHLLICKGAVEEVVALCNTVQLGNQVINLTQQFDREMRQTAERLEGEGLRTIAVAYKQLSPHKTRYGVQDEINLTLLGYLTFLDPLKHEVGEAIAILQNQGVGIKVITGDAPGVTRKICQDVGLDSQFVCLGNTVESISDDELTEVVENTVVFAKMSPLQKARVVRLLQQQGHIVGYVGDGINDALALRNADVGISVDTAVDVAKECADIILLEKSLMVLRSGIWEGRRTFANILKYLKMTASSNFGNVFSVLGASLLLPFLPMLPIHLLIQNLLYDLSQIAIPFDDVDRDYLAKPQKWLVSDIQRFMLCFGLLSSIFDYATFAVLWFVLGARTEEAAPLFQSGWFVVGLLSQVLIIHVIRTSRLPFVESAAAVPVWWATLIVIAIGVIFPFTPLGEIVGMVPLPMIYFPWLVMILVSYCLLTQVVKQGYIRQFGRWL
jgi:Mg2+-importing ATPase